MAIDVMAGIPVAFTEKKRKILKALSIPDDQYHDLSPKGSVDVGIKGLIEKINAIDGLVTTSSCAGRISVFLEGTKMESKDALRGDTTLLDLQSVVPGGKGRGGRWLFVSHDSVPIPHRSREGTGSTAELFHISSQRDGSHIDIQESSRFIKFQFEPMILHVMAASLKHAQPVLSAAINAGFRESGVQSLKNLDDPNAFPMVAVRSSGLAFSSLIGIAESGDLDVAAQSIVDEEYLRLLLGIANGRFQANTERVRRFEHEVVQNVKTSQPLWESEDSRRERKRAQGLEEQSRLRAEGNEKDPSRETAIFRGDEDAILQGLVLEDEG